MSELHLPYKTSTLATSFSNGSDSIMKKFTLDVDRVVVVRKTEGQLAVVVKQKKSDIQFTEFTPYRYVV